MKKSQLSDKQLEEILGQMPKIKDNRDPRDIYQNIAHRVGKRRFPGWVLPGVAAAAVLLLAFVLSPGLIDWNQSADKSSEIESTENAKMASDKDMAEEKEQATKESLDKDDSKLMQQEKSDEGNQFMAMKTPNPYADLTALYEPELGEDHQALTYVIPDKPGQLLVPITVTVSNAEQEWIDTFTGTMPKLKEEEWGLSDFYPVDGSWSYDDSSKTLNLDVKPDHIYRHGSISNTMLIEGMSRNLAGKGIEKLSYSTNGEQGIEFGNYGVKYEDDIPADSLKRRAYMLYFPEGTNQSYLVPTKEQFKTIDAAFEQMRGYIEEQHLSSSLPEHFTLDQASLEKDDKVLRIVIADNKGITEEFLTNIEAILLTAKEFDYQAVKIENAGAGQLGPFNLNENLPLPLAPNKKDID